MPANKSEQKVRVTKTFDGGHPVGWMDPKPNMKVRYGQQDLWIKALDSGNFTVSLSLTSGGAVIAKAHPHDLMVPSGTVGAYFGFPNGGGAQKAGRVGLFAGGVPTAVGSGTAYLDGTGTVRTFGR